MRDFDLAEDARQDPVAAALETWPTRGIPDNPGAWLMVTALDTYHLFHAARTDLLRRAGRLQEAASAYRQALTLATNAAEQDFLQARLAEVSMQ